MVTVRFKKKLIQGLLGLCLLFAVYQLYIGVGVVSPVENGQSTLSQEIKVPERPDPVAEEIKKLNKIILLWNGIYGLNHPRGWSFHDERGFKEAGCRVTNCEFRNQRSEINKADAVIFHIPTLYNEKPTLNLGERKPSQVWIYMNMETPCETHGDDYIAEWIGPLAFNWTMTFRHASDVPMFYGQYCKREVPANLDYEAIMKEKTRFAFTFLSNCGDTYNSKRETYLKLLRSHLEPLQIDVFGKCGSNMVEARDKRCLAELAAKYKFYIAFENSFATDFISDRVYSMLPHNVVPVYRGAGNLKQVGAVPPHSVIHTANFDGVASVAKYLKLLHKHDGGYTNYLKWKESYEVTYEEPDALRCSIKEHSYCKLCSMLNEEHPSKTIENIRSWWKYHCYGKIDIS